MRVFLTDWASSFDSRNPIGYIEDILRFEKGRGRKRIGYQAGCVPIETLGLPLKSPLDSPLPGGDPLR